MHHWSVSRAGLPRGFSVNAWSDEFYGDLEQDRIGPPETADLDFWSLSVAPEEAESWEYKPEPKPQPPGGPRFAETFDFKAAGIPVANAASFDHEREQARLERKAYRDAAEARLAAEYRKDAAERHAREVEERLEGAAIWDRVAAAMKDPARAAQIAEVISYGMERIQGDDNKQAFALHWLECRELGLVLPMTWDSVILTERRIQAAKRRAQTLKATITRAIV